MAQWGKQWAYTHERQYLYNSQEVRVACPQSKHAENRDKESQRKLTGGLATSGSLEIKRELCLNM